MGEVYRFPKQKELTHHHGELFRMEHLALILSKKERLKDKLDIFLSQASKAEIKI